MPRAGFYCPPPSPFFFPGDSLIIFPAIFYFPVFAISQTFNCYENSQVVFAQMHTSELLNVNHLVDKWGLVAIFNYAVLCNVSDKHSSYG